jgi:hypothetical protein
VRARCGSRGSRGQAERTRRSSARGPSERRRGAGPASGRPSGGSELRGGARCAGISRRTAGEQLRTRARQGSAGAAATREGEKKVLLCAGVRVVFVCAQCVNLYSWWREEGVAALCCCASCCCGGVLLLSCVVVEVVVCWGATALCGCAVIC